MSVLGFEGEWFDHVSGLLQKVYVKFFLENDTLELLTDKTAFLKRIFYPDVTIQDLYIGNSITVYNRLIVLKKFANTATADYMISKEVRFLCVIRSTALTTSFHKCLLLAKKHKLRMGRVLTVSSDILVDPQQSASNGDTLLEIVGLSTAAKIHFYNEVSQIGPSVYIKESGVEALSQLFRQCESLKGAHNSTLCLVKPHSIKNLSVGDILKCISDNGFTFKGFYSIHLTSAYAEELFDTYRNIYTNYSAVIEHLCSSACLAVMVTGSSDGDNIVSSFRDFVGPLDPQLAKAVRPHSIRAIFGEDSIKNAVHCTDLEEDGEIECRYFFESLASL